MILPSTPHNGICIILLTIVATAVLIILEIAWCKRQVLFPLSPKRKIIIGRMSVLVVIVFILVIVFIIIMTRLDFQGNKKTEGISEERLKQILDEMLAVQKQKGESDERVEQRRELFSEAERAGLKHEFSFGYMLFIISFSDFTITERERGIPPNENGKPNETAFDWMGNTHVEIDGSNVLFKLPYIVMPPNLIMLGNKISLLRKTDVGLTLNIDPCHPPGLFRGNTLSSTQPETEISLSKEPTLSIVVKILSINDKGILMVLGLKPYKNTGVGR